MSPSCYDSEPPSSKPDMTIAYIMDRAQRHSIASGFTDNTIWQDIGNLMAEAAESWEEIRKKDFIPTRTYYRESDQKPEGLPSELADVVIRACDTAAKYGIDLTEAIFRKMEFNETRPHRHGGRRS